MRERWNRIDRRALFPGKRSPTHEGSVRLQRRDHAMTNIGIDTFDTTMTTDAAPHEYIGSDRVDGTNVYRPDGEKIGHIKRIMIEKRSGQAVYAVMNFGGFLGLGQDSYPLPWSLLTYNTDLGGYEVNLSDEQLKDAPKFMEDENFDLGDGERDRRINDYYGVAPYDF
jgi:hypothetical protein